MGMMCCWMFWVTMIVVFWFKHCRCFEANLDSSYLSWNSTQHITESTPSSWTTDELPQYKGLTSISPTLSTSEETTPIESVSSNSISQKRETTPIETQSLNIDSVSPTLGSIYTSYFKDQSQINSKETERTQFKEDSSVKSISNKWLETQKFQYVTLQPSENDFLESSRTESSKFILHTSASLDGVISSSEKIGQEKDHTLLLSSSMFIYSDSLSAQEKASGDILSTASHPFLSSADKDTAISSQLSSSLSSSSQKMLSVQMNSISAEISYKGVQSLDLTTNLYSPSLLKTTIPSIEPSLSYSSIATSEIQVREIIVSTIVISNAQEDLFPQLHENFHDASHSKSLGTTNEPQTSMSDELTTHQGEQIPLALFKKSKDQIPSTKSGMLHTSVNHFVSETQETPNTNLISPLSDAESDLVHNSASFEKSRTKFLRTLNTRLLTESIESDRSELSTTVTRDLGYRSSIENSEHVSSNFSTSSSNVLYIPSAASYSTSLLSTQFIKNNEKFSLSQTTKIDIKQSENNLFHERMKSVSADVWKTSIPNYSSFHLTDHNNDIHLQSDQLSTTSLYHGMSYMSDLESSTEYHSYSPSFQFLSDTSEISVAPSYSKLRVESKTIILESETIANRDGEYSQDETLNPEPSMDSVYSYKHTTHVSSSHGLMSAETLSTSLSPWSLIDPSPTSYSLNPTRVQENGNRTISTLTGRKKFHSSESHSTPRQTERFSAVNSNLRFNDPKTIYNDITNHNSLVISSENLQSMYLVTSLSETISELEQRTVQSEVDTLNTSLFQPQYSTIQPSFFTSIPDHWDFQTHVTTPLLSSSDKSAAESLSIAFKTREEAYEDLSKQTLKEIVSASSPNLASPSSQSQMIILSQSKIDNNWGQNDTMKDYNASQYELWNHKSYDQSESNYLKVMTSKNKALTLELTSSTQYFRSNARSDFYHPILSHSITSRPVIISSGNEHAGLFHMSTLPVESTQIPQATEIISTSSFSHLHSEISYSLSEFNHIRSASFDFQIHNTKETSQSQIQEGVGVYKTSTAALSVDPHTEFPTTGGETTILNSTIFKDISVTSSHGINVLTENSTNNADASTVPSFENTGVKYVINESSIISLQASVGLHVPHSSRNLMLKQGDISLHIPGVRTTEYVAPSVVESSVILQYSIIQSSKIHINDYPRVVTTAAQSQQNFESLSSISKQSITEDSAVEFTKIPTGPSVIDATFEDSIAISPVDFDSSFTPHTSSNHIQKDFSETNTAALSHQNFESASPVFKTSSIKDFASEFIKVSTDNSVVDTSYMDSIGVSLDKFDSTFVQHTSELPPVIEVSSVDMTQLSMFSFSTKSDPLSTRASVFLLSSSPRLGTSFLSDGVHSKLPFYSKRQSELETILPSVEKVSSRNEKLATTVLSIPEISKQMSVMHTQYFSSPASESIQVQEEETISADYSFPRSIPASLLTTNNGFKMTRSTMYAELHSPTVKTKIFSTLEQSKSKIKSEIGTKSSKGKVIHSSVSSEIDISPSVFAVSSTSIVVYPFPETNLLVIEINVKIGNDVSNENFKVKLEEGLTTIYIEGLQDRKKRYSIEDSSGRGKERGIKVKIKEIKRKFGERVEVVFLVTYDGIVVSAPLAEMAFQKMSDVEMSAILGYPVVMPVSRLTSTTTPPSGPGGWEELFHPLVIVLIALPTSIVLISSIIAIIIQCRSKSAHRHPSVPRQMESLYKHNLVVDVENGDVRNRRISYEYPSDDEYSMASSDVFNEIKSKYSQSMHSKIKNFEKLNIKNHFHNQLERKPSDALTNKVKFSVSGEESQTNCVKTDSQECNDSGVSSNEQKSPAEMPDHPISKMESVPQITCTNTSHVAQNHKNGQNNLQIPPGSKALQNPYPVKNKTNLVNLSSERVTSWVFLGDSPGVGDDSVPRVLPENREIHDKMLESDAIVQINQDFNYIPSKCDSECQTSNQNTYSGVQDHIYETLDKKESKKSDQSTETDSQPGISGSDGFEYLEPLRKLLMAVEQHRRRVPPVDQFLNGENKLQNCIHGFCNMGQCPASSSPFTASSQSGNTHNMSFPDESTRKYTCESERLKQYSVSVSDCEGQKTLESNDDVFKERQLVKNHKSPIDTQNSIQSDSSSESCIYDQPVMSFAGFTSTVEI